MLQLQGEAERLQLQLSQAESKRRVAEQRAQDAEQVAEELQLRISALQKAQRQAAAAADAPAESGAAVRLKFKVGACMAGSLHGPHAFATHTALVQ